MRGFYSSGFKQEKYWTEYHKSLSRIFLSLKIKNIRDQNQHLGTAWQRDGQDWASHSFKVLVWRVWRKWDISWSSVLCCYPTEAILVLLNHSKILQSSTSERHFPETRNPQRGDYRAVDEGDFMRESFVTRINKRNNDPNNDLASWHLLSAVYCNLSINTSHYSLMRLSIIPIYLRENRLIARKCLSRWQLVESPRLASWTLSSD